MVDHESNLSAAGRDRRQRILALARTTARRRRHRRQFIRTAAGAAVVVASLLLLTHRADKPASPPLAGGSKPQVVPTRRIASIDPAPRPAGRRTPEVVIQFIKTDPGLARQMAVPRQPPTWQRLSDDELLRQLANAGRPAALAWVDGRETILFREERPFSVSHFLTPEAAGLPAP